MASSRTAGPRVGGLVPWTITGPASLAASAAYILPLPTCRYRVGRINVGGVVGTDTFTLDVGNTTSSTLFVNQQSLAVGTIIGDYASADLTEKTATGGTTYLIITLTRATTATFVNATITVWLWMSSPPTSLARRGDPGALNQTGL